MSFSVFYDVHESIWQTPSLCDFTNSENCQSILPFFCHLYRSFSLSCHFTHYGVTGYHAALYLYSNHFMCLQSQKSLRSVIISVPCHQIRLFVWLMKMQQSTSYQSFIRGRHEPRLALVFDLNQEIDWGISFCNLSLESHPGDVLHFFSSMGELRVWLV